MEKTFDRRLRGVLVCKGGPENGPFSAMAARILTEELPAKGIDIVAIYACSGSTPTALLGCIGDYPKLCDIWANLTPEQVVGKKSKIRTTVRAIRGESILPNDALRDLIKKSWDLEKIFSQVPNFPEALPIKFPAVDISNGEYIIFSNKDQGHKKWFLEGVLGSMGVVPFLPPQRVFNPEEAGLIERSKAKHNGLLLIDGGFMGNMLLEEAMRDNFDIIFLIDIHGFKLVESRFDVTRKHHWGKLTRYGFHVITTTNDLRQFQMADRINEEIRIKNELLELAIQLSGESAQVLRGIIDRMNEGRLRLGDKTETKIYIVSNEKYATLFNFSDFTQHKETVRLLTAGYEAAYKRLEEIG